MPKGQKPYRPATKPSTITPGTWLNRSDDLTPRSNLPDYQYQGVGKQAPLNPAISAAVKRGAIRKD